MKTYPSRSPFLPFTVEPKISRVRPLSLNFLASSPISPSAGKRSLPLSGTRSSKNDRTARPAIPASSTPGEERGAAVHPLDGPCRVGDDDPIGKALQDIAEIILHLLRFQDRPFEFRVLFFQLPIDVGKLDLEARIGLFQGVGCLVEIVEGLLKKLNMAHLLFSIRLFSAIYRSAILIQNSVAFSSLTRAKLFSASANSPRRAVSLSDPEEQPPFGVAVGLRQGLSVHPDPLLEPVFVEVAVPEPECTSPRAGPRRSDPDAAGTPL